MKARLLLSSLGNADTRAEYGEELRAHLRAHESELSDEVRVADRHQPAAGLRLRPPGHARGDGRGAAADRPPRPRGRRRTSRRCAPCWRRRAARTSSTRRSCAGWTTTRARCSSSRAPTSARRAEWAAAGATTAWWSSSADRPRRGSAGRPGWSGSCWLAGRDARSPRARARTWWWPSPTSAGHGLRAGAGPPRGGRHRRDGAGGPLDQGPDEAGRPGAAPRTW